MKLFASNYTKNTQSAFYYFLSAQYLHYSATEGIDKGICAIAYENPQIVFAHEEGPQ